MSALSQPLAPAFGNFILSNAYRSRVFILLTLSFPIISVTLTGRRTSLFVDPRCRKASCHSSSVSLSAESTAKFMMSGTGLYL